MPKALPPLEPKPPFPLSVSEAKVVKDTVRRFYGKDAVIRNFGSDPEYLQLHVETSCVLHHLDHADCLGILFTLIDRKFVDLVSTKRGGRIVGLSKVAYRQGETI